MRGRFSKQLIVSLLSMALAGLSLPVFANSTPILRGGVEEENYRLTHPDAGSPLRGRADDGLRISRAPAALRGSAVDSSAFAGTAESGRTSPLSGGVVDSSPFAQPPKNFDIGAERGSREMVLAWEKWHHQLSQAIYERWQRIARDPGKATIKLTVTRDRHISAQVINSHGGPAFEAEIMEAILSLDGNPGLTFPSKSQRNVVSFDADYIAGSDVTPGYSWVKNDYEKVHQDY